MCRKIKELESLGFVGSGGLGLPDSSGVYAVCLASFHNLMIENARLVYIGSSKNIQKRVYSPKHLYRKLHNRSNNFLVYIIYLECDNYLKLEKELIIRLNPILNKQHRSS